MIQLSSYSKNALLDALGLRAQIEGGKLVLYAGPVPASADAALNLAASHTELLVIEPAVDGLLFATPSGGVLAKDPSQVWSGTVTFSGAEDSETSLAPTFFRMVAAGDDPADAATTGSYRIQGTVGGPNSGADLQLGTVMLTDGNLQSVGTASFAVV